MDRWKGIMLYDLDYSYYQRYIETVRNTTAEDLILLAKKYFDESSFYELVVGKK
jgi:predicted Zn-dependent peptidase